LSRDPIAEEYTGFHPPRIMKVHVRVAEALPIPLKVYGGDPLNTLQGYRRPSVPPPTGPSMAPATTTRFEAGLQAGPSCQRSGIIQHPTHPLRANMAEL